MKIRLTKKQKRFLRESYRVRSDAELSRALSIPEDHIRSALEALGLHRTREEEEAVRRKDGLQKVGGGFPKLLLITVAPVLVLCAVVFLLYRNDRKSFSRETFSKTADRNVLFIIVDTLRADHLGCYGYQGVETPHIDRLAKDGVIFTHATSQVPLTLPSHCSILTGTYPAFHGVRDNGGFYLEEDKTTLAEILKDYGYATSAFIGAFVLDSRWGVNQGFDYYYDDFDLSRYEVVTLEGVERPGGDVVKEAFRWWDENGRKKFFSWIHLYDPHPPYSPPEPYERKYRSNPYGGEVAYVDALIGQIRDKLEAMGVADNTIIVFTADHGEMLGEHGESGHGFFLYDAATRIPLVIQAPGLESRVIDAQVQSLDIVPTVLDMLGIAIPSDVQGQSLLPMFLNGESDTDELYAYSETFFPRYRFGWSELKSVRTREFKYIEAPKPELYDLREDPEEERNLFASRPEIAERFKKRLAEITSAHSEEGAKQKAPQMMDEETLQGLAALGYLGAPVLTVEEDSGVELPDPKDRVELYNKIREAERKSAENRLDEALTDVTEVLEVDPTIRTAHLILGNIQVKKKDFKKAIDAFQDALEIDPNSAYSVFCLAQAYKQTANWEKAIASFEKLIEMDPRHPRAYLHLGDIYEKQGAYDRAIHCLEKAVELEPSAVAYSRLGTCYLNTDRLQEAEREINRALELDPQLPGVHFNLGLIYARTDRYMESIEAFQKVIRIRPDYTRAHLFLGLVYGSLGRREEERESFKAVIRIDPNDADARFLLGMSYLEQGDRDSALEQYEILKKLSPELALQLRNKLNE